MSEHADRERGMTLVELIIAMGIGTTVALLAVYVLVTTFRTQGQVTASTKAATQGQSVSEIIDRAIRTAAYVRPAGDRLDVRSATGGCQAFAITPDGQLHETNTAGSDTQITSDPSTWPVLAVAVSPLHNPDGTAVPYFAAPSGATAGSGAAYSFRLQGTVGAVDVVSSAFKRIAGGTISPCLP